MIVASVAQLACNCRKGIGHDAAALLAWVGVPFVGVTTIWLGVRRRRAVKQGSRPMDDESSGARYDEL